MYSSIVDDLLPVRTTPTATITCPILKVKRLTSTRCYWEIWRRIWQPVYGHQGDFQNFQFGKGGGLKPILMEFNNICNNVLLYY